DGLASSSDEMSAGLAAIISAKNSEAPQSSVNNLRFSALTVAGVVDLSSEAATRSTDIRARSEFAELAAVSSSNFAVSSTLRPETGAARCGPNSEAAA